MGLRRREQERWHAQTLMEMGARRKRHDGGRAAWSWTRKEPKTDGECLGGGRGWFRDYV